MTNEINSGRWDVFRAYRENRPAHHQGFWSSLPDYCIAVQTADGVKFALSKNEINVGSDVSIYTGNAIYNASSSNGWEIESNNAYGYPPAVSYYQNTTKKEGEVIACFSRNGMANVDLMTADPLQIAAIGEFMVGQPLLPLFVTDMLLHLQSCLQSAVSHSGGVWNNE